MTTINTVALNFPNLKSLSISCKSSDKRGEMDSNEIKTGELCPSVTERLKAFEIIDAQAKEDDEILKMPSNPVVRRKIKAK